MTHRKTLSLLAVAALVLVLAVVIQRDVAAGRQQAGAAVGEADPRLHAVEVEVLAEAGPFGADRRLVLRGANFYGTARGPFVRFERGEGVEPIEAVAVILETDGRIVAYPPAGTYGPCTVRVENPDGRSATIGASL